MKATFTYLVLISFCLLLQPFRAQIENDTARRDEKALSEQVEEMLQELRNQNQAIFKHAGHSRILSQKVSELTKDVKKLTEDNEDLRQRLQIVEFKAGKKFKKLKTKLEEVDLRLDLCKCPNQPQSDSKDVKRNDKNLKRNHGKRKKNKIRKLDPDIEDTVSRKISYSHHLEPTGGFGKEADEVYPQRASETLDQPQQRRNYDVAVDDNSWRTTLGYNQIFITSGSSNKSEILDVSVGYDACPPPADYPLKVQGAVGTFMAGRPLVCGGRSSIEDYFNDCFYYNVNNNTWSSSTPMLERRFQATAVMLGSDRWWITGGFNGDLIYNNTEIYNPATGFEPGPNLPEVTFQHCLVKFNSSHIFSVGGFPYNNNAWILDFPSGKWTKQRPIPHLRDAPHCAMVERLNGRIEIIVAGGSLPGSELATEIFSVADNRWRQGPSLPKAIIYGVSIPFRNSLLILGGREMGGDLGELDSIFEYDSTKEMWSKRDKRLRRSRTSFVAISLPDYLSCTNNFKPFSSSSDNSLYYNWRQTMMTATTTQSNRFFGSFN